jgi:hypothetical protein
VAIGRREGNARWEAKEESGCEAEAERRGVKEPFFFSSQVLFYVDPIHGYVLKYGSE